MRLFDWRSLVVSSVSIFAGVVCSGMLASATAETRPQYGGTLRVAMRAAPASLDPAYSDPAEGDSTKSYSANGTPADSFARRSLIGLMFDTLVTVDGSGQVQPALATSWQALQTNQPGNQAGNQRWQFRIRRAVKFHDGTPLSAEVAAASLRFANPAWNVTVSADGDAVVIERATIERSKIEPASSDSDLLTELALPRNAIVKRNGDNAPGGTGGFHVIDWKPAKTLTLAADEDCWRGRPFLDAIEIEMGKSFREQMTALELGRADLVEIAPEQTHRLAQEGRRVTSSSPVELLALLFARDATSPDEKLLREALALSIERGSIRSVLLQGAGEPAAGILPNWMGGYEFIFPTSADLARARQARDQVHTIPMWTLGYDGSDPIAHLLAERVALNAKDAGLALQPSSAASVDLRLVRIPLASRDPWISLSRVAAIADIPTGKESGSVEDLYASERAALITQRMIPLFHLPVSYAASASLNNWSVRPDGSWTVAEAWLGNVKRD
jgi:ABC-type transport system substrate-binding protein